MDNGLFITLYDEKTLELYLKYGIYGFLMKPIYKEQPNNRSMHYNALADYACAREGTHIFFFLKRKIYYGGTIKGNKRIASFYLNGSTSPLGRKAGADLFWNESIRYGQNNDEGVFIVNENEKSQPFILLFEKVQGLSGKHISSDELYFELGKYPYPLPTNTIQGMGFCTMTPGEVGIALSLIENGTDLKVINSEEIECKENSKIFHTELLEDKFINEAHLEFTLLADLRRIGKVIPKGNYTSCRQVPISPFKPFNIDRADICLYDKDKPLKDGTIPNVLIELKKDKANYHAYQQVVRYLDWLIKIAPDEFEEIYIIIIAPTFYINRKKIDTKYIDKIKMYSLEKNEFYII